MVSVIYFKNMTPSETPAEKYHHWVARKPGMHTVSLCLSMGITGKKIVNSVNDRLTVSPLMRHGDIFRETSA